MHPSPHPRPTSHQPEGFPLGGSSRRSRVMRGSRKAKPCRRDFFWGSCRTTHGCSASYPSSVTRGASFPPRGSLWSAQRPSPAIPDAPVSASDPHLTQKRLPCVKGAPAKQVRDCPPREVPRSKATKDAPTFLIILTLKLEGFT